MRYTPEKITSLEPGEIFVFGSNLLGIHGAGAAHFAHEHFRAEWGVGVGLTGRCYAIPTKDEQIQTLPLPVIAGHVYEFLQFARRNHYLSFLVTPIGCGLAGLSPKDIAPMFLRSVFNPRCLPSNVILPKSFFDVLCHSGR